MIHGIDNFSSLERENRHSFTGYYPEDIEYCSSNIVAAMENDPLWQESIDAKQKVLDRFAVIGHTAERLRREGKL